MQIDFSAIFERVNDQGILYRLCSVCIGGSVGGEPTVPHSCDGGEPTVPYSCVVGEPTVPYSCVGDEPTVPYSCVGGEPTVPYSCGGDGKGGQLSRSAQ